MATLLKAARSFKIGPASQRTTPGDVLDLEDPGWTLPRERIFQLLEQKYGMPTDEPVTLRPNVVHTPAAITGAVTLTRGASLPPLPVLPELPT